MVFIFRVLLFTSLLYSSGVFAQEQPLPKFRIREKGFLTGVGYGINSLNLPQGRYVPLFFMGHFSADFPRLNQRQTNKSIFTIYAEPQFNPVILQKPEENSMEYEFGSNFGIQYMYPLTKNIYSYINIGSGPHYISVHTYRQATGFIFSDNMGTGFYFFFSKSIALNTTFRLRHMSNANTRMPNEGINTFNFMAGISKFIR